jgi:hypothetical protein
MKPLILALGTAAALAIAAPTAATAQHHGAFRHGRHWSGGHWRGGFWRGPRVRFGFGFGVPYYRNPYYAYGSCYRRFRVLTPFGWRWRRRWVC